MVIKSKIHFILTGGTIDSHYDATKDTAIPDEQSSIPRFIKSLKLYDKTVFTEICMKDSRDLTKSDIKKICSAVENSKSDKIIITHGTYTMLDTARYIQANLRNKEKVIVFTGSMIPLMGFAPSDAPFQLGFSIAKVNELDNGIYVCMHGQVFSPDEIVKTLSEGRFSSVFNK